MLSLVRHLYLISDKHQTLRYLLEKQANSEIQLELGLEV